MVPYYTKANTQWCLWEHLNFRFTVKVARESSRSKLCLPKSELCHPKFLVKSPERLSHVARNFITLNNTLASLLHIYRAFFVSSKIKKRDILPIYRACFVVHQGLRAKDITHELIRPVSFHHRFKNEACYKFIPLVS